jgi:hypothetical protein
MRKTGILWNTEAVRYLQMDHDVLAAPTCKPALLQAGAEGSTLCRGRPRNHIGCHASC